MGYDENYVELETSTHVGVESVWAFGGLGVVLGQWGGEWSLVRWLAGRVILSGVYCCLALCYSLHGSVAWPRHPPPLEVGVSSLVLNAFGIVLFGLKNKIALPLMQRCPYWREREEIIEHKHTFHPSNIKT